MQGSYAERFEREMGCTEAEWLQWLPRAAGDGPLRVGEREATVAIGRGALHLRWHALAPRAIALLSIPRLHVSFAFDGVAEDERQAFMQRFDRFTQRGGG